jgi:hypothetical protein
VDDYTIDAPGFDPDDWSLTDPIEREDSAC